MKEREKKSEKKKMVAIALYRGNLHRVPNTPRRWPPPSRSLSSSQFRSLLRRRSLALSRLSSPPPPPPSQDDTEEDAKEKEDNHSVPKEEQQQQQKQEVVEEEEEEEEGELADSDSTDNPSHLDPPLPVKKEEEVTITPLKAEAGLTDKEERKRELENKLEELNLKKHNLVQMLKQILNAEEEMKRRINPSTVARGSSGPVPSESGPDAPSASKPGPGRMSVEVNFGTDLGGESDPGSTQSAHTRPFCQMQSPSPSGSSLSRSPFDNSVMSQVCLLYCRCLELILQPLRHLLLHLEVYHLFSEILVLVALHDPKLLVLVQVV
ncbi:uncharacterized protein LOC144545163 isoform X2 [Carex rostrata]